MFNITMAVEDYERLLNRQMGKVVHLLDLRVRVSSLLSLGKPQRSATHLLFDGTPCKLANALVAFANLVHFGARMVDNIAGRSQGMGVKNEEDV